MQFVGRRWKQNDHMAKLGAAYVPGSSLFPQRRPRPTSPGKESAPPSFRAIIKSEPSEGDGSRQPTLGSSGDLRGSKMELTKKMCPFILFLLLEAKDMSAAAVGRCCRTLQEGLIFKQEILTSCSCSPVTKVLLTQMRCVIYVTFIMGLEFKSILCVWGAEVCPVCPTGMRLKWRL